MDNENIQNNNEIEQLVSSWKLSKRIWCGIVDAIDRCVPIVLSATIGATAVTAYANTVNDTTVIIPNFMLSSISCGVVWVSIRIAYKSLKELND
jgi:hypothetical protein